MKSFLKEFFVNNWPRKCLSIVLAVIIWLVVNQSLTTVKTINNIPVRIINIPPGKTVEGLQSNDFLKKRISLTLAGNKALLDELNANDLEVVIDASNQRDEWIVTITKKHLYMPGANGNLLQGISKVSRKSLSIKLTKLVTEKIPVIITKPIGEAPKGYQFVDIWPLQLNITVSGPEEDIKKLRARGLKLTFNLSDISKAQLDDLASHSSSQEKDLVSFFVPAHWKQISLPSLSNTPIDINDPNAKYLRIDFIRSELIPLGAPLMVNLFYPFASAESLNPQTLKIQGEGLIQMRYGLPMIARPLFAKGVSELFVDIVRDMLELSIVVKPVQEETFEYSLQFVNQRDLEERYVSLLMSDTSDPLIDELQPQIRKEYLRNRFRNYMNRFQLFKNDQTPLELEIHFQDNKIIVSEKS